MPSETAIRAIDTLREEGATVETVAVDVTDRGAIASILSRINKELHPLKGIVHAAGVLSDSLIVNTGPDLMRQVLAPKVVGGWNLHCLTLDMDLDFFVLYSSVASMLGSPGQAGHAAANAFLDSLAHYRRARKLPALSINWGPWETVGKAAAASLSEKLTTRGLKGLEPSTALALLNRLLASNIAQAGVFSLDRHQWTEFYPHLKHSSFLKAIKDEQVSSQKVVAAEEDLRFELLATPLAQRRQKLLAQVRNQAARVLGVESKRLDPTVPLQTYGLDSLRALELRNVLERITNQKISAVVCWKYPTVEELTLFLGQLMDVSLENVGTAPMEPENGKPSQSVVDLLQLTEAEATKLLTEKLATLGGKGANERPH
jgi:aryl carrier-like protein/short-subunit dehydrogenase